MAAKTGVGVKNVVGNGSGKIIFLQAKAAFPHTETIFLRAKAVFLRSKTTSALHITGKTSLVRLWVRVAAKGSNNTGAWSDPALVTVP